MQGKVGQLMDSLAGHAMAGQSWSVGPSRARQLRQAGRPGALMRWHAPQGIETAARALAVLELHDRDFSETPVRSLGTARRQSEMAPARASCARLTRLQPVVCAVAAAAPTQNLVLRSAAACSARRRAEQPWRSTWSPSAGARKGGLA